MEVAKVTSAEALREHYWLLEEACERLTAREGRLHFAPDIYGTLMRGDAQMTVMVEDQQLVGLFTTKVNGDALHVWHAYVRPGAARDTLQRGLAECELQAGERGCTRLTFGTQRRGWLRLAPMLGYELAEFKFTKEVRS
ncbi:hypothetical protein NL64_06190 [Pseudomonas fluorescens]|uniref:hypothetical protein n=1 Tax=Pseudomonas fluorescens TaxID=294 RepID=UPI00054B60DC|nr:hypothetical protein [Pseudomonas fluorescens]KII34850.1 hypothetical protein NL64_06190 [Pseudomonas fluorescens]